MSTPSEQDLDLEKLLFLPAWAKESPQANPYAKYEGETGRREERRRDRPDRPPRRPEGAPGRRPPGSPGRPAGGPGRPLGRASGSGTRDRDRDRGRDRDRRGLSERPVPEPEPLPQVNVALTPEEQAVDLLTKQIRITGRAFPLFDIAQLILAKPERHSATFSVKKKPDGSVIQPLFLCQLDETLWLSEDEAIRHVLDKHFNTFYQPERIKVDPPKGVYTFVAQCGMSGVVLGPPNYHYYQNQLRRLHAERFARMPFEAFKARVRIVKDEEVVKKWVEEQSWKTEYVCLNLPEALRLNNREEVEKHFRQVHLGNIVRAVETHRMSGAASRGLRDRGLLRLLRLRWEEQKRFPIQVATVLSQQFASRGLQFFKVNKTVTHVAVARPHYLDLESSPVSDSVQRIVDFINAHPKCSPKQLIEALAPRPAPPPAVPSAEVPAPAGETGGASAAAAAAAAVETTPEMAAVLADLSWLVRQGHVIEFANGALETAKKPLPKPPKAATAEGRATPAEGSVAPAAPAVATIEPLPVPEPLPAAELPPLTTDEPGASPIGEQTAG